MRELPDRFVAAGARTLSVVDDHRCLLHLYDHSGEAVSDSGVQRRVFRYRGTLPWEPRDA